ncbi:hypothetical protein [Bernardetia litoralis]|uniref:hypothetical protein n=1 Tax=Bernardetia litoralis TaxID=999 RepID=UPI00059CCFED|nr:hypothetical protein [Bernardetia litoralis]
MPNTYKSLGKAKRQQFLDSRARAGGKILNLMTLPERGLGGKQIQNTYTRKSKICQTDKS